MTKMSKEEIIKAIEGLSVLELNELVQSLEEKFGVTGSMMSSSTNVPTTPSTELSSSATEAEEKTAFDVELTEMGSNKISVIKAVREINNALGLSEAKTLVESAPKMVVENVKKEAAEEARKKLEAAGAKVTLS